MPKKLIFVTAIPLKCDSTMINFMLGGVDNQKTQFRQSLKFWPKKKSQISSLYNLGPKQLKKPKIHKIAKNGQKVTKVSFF